eukprot:XP_025014491.1 uncharacterized protein LOC112536134 [Ricinus communis]
MASSLKQEIRRCFGFSQTNNLGKYLGMMLIHDRITKNTFKSISEKIKLKLSGRKADHLSLAGRITSGDSNFHNVNRIYPPIWDLGLDTLIWNFSKSGQITSKLAFEFIVGDCDFAGVNVWSRIYKWRGLQRIQSTLWLVAHQRLASASLCARHSIIPSTMYGRCKSSDEDTNHAVRDCLFAKCIW